VNTNFDDLVTFLGDDTIHRDGSKAYTGDQSMGSNNLTDLAAPTGDNDAARKVYVDAYVDARERTLDLSFGESGLVVNTDGYRWYAPYDITIVDMQLSVGVAPTGSSAIVDVHKNGTTIFTTQGNRPTVADGAFVDTAAVPDVTAVAAGDYLEVMVDQRGSSVSGRYGMLVITYTKDA
jgi:hypothetical protein